MSPAQNYSREKSDEYERLMGGKREIFHSIVAKLLYIMKRSRPDLGISKSINDD